METTLGLRVLFRKYSKENDITIPLDLFNKDLQPCLDSFKLGWFLSKIQLSSQFACKFESCTVDKALELYNDRSIGSKDLNITASRDRKLKSKLKKKCGNVINTLICEDYKTQFVSIPFEQFINCTSMEDLFLKALIYSVKPYKQAWSVKLLLQYIDYLNTNNGMTVVNFKVSVPMVKKVLRESNNQKGVDNAPPVFTEEQINLIGLMWPVGKQTTSQSFQY